MVTTKIINPPQRKKTPAPFMRLVEFRGFPIGLQAAFPVYGIA